MKKKISLIYKILILIACTISIYLNFEAFTVQGAVIYYKDFLFKSKERV